MHTRRGRANVSSTRHGQGLPKRAVGPAFTTCAALFGGVLSGLRAANVAASKRRSAAEEDECESEAGTELGCMGPERAPQRLRLSGQVLALRIERAAAHNLYRQGGGCLMRQGNRNFSDDRIREGSSSRSGGAASPTAPFRSGGGVGSTSGRVERGRFRPPSPWRGCLGGSVDRSVDASRR
jgi:hypothetical protein